MSIHIGADKNDIAETVLLPGDPLRASYVAENFFENPQCYNKVRGMLGYTGTYQGKRVSVQGSGMGLPSLSIYVNELINEYGVKTIIRIGSCGSYNKDVKLRDVVLAMTSSTDSAINKLRFKGMDYAPVADFGLLYKAYSFAQSKNISVHVGGIVSSDTFYNDDPEAWKLWAEYGALAVEMETTALYTICAKKRTRALSVLTVSDSLVDGSSTSSEERENTFSEMVQIALAAAF